VLPYSDTDKDWIDLRYLLESRGLQHVRTLTVDSSNVNTYGFCKPLDQLLPRLPLKSLTQFRYGPLGQPTDEGLRYLLQLDFSLMAPSLEELIREEGPAIRSLKSLTELDLTLGDERDTSAEKYSELIDMIETARLKKVSLFADINGYWNTETGKELMERILKRSLSTSLTHISLSNVCLPQSNRQHLELDNCYSLWHLEILECTNVASLLDVFRQPILKSFVVRFRPVWDPDSEDLEAAIVFLQRFGSLNRLIISSEATVASHENLVALARSIASHAKSLSSLVVNLDGNDISWNHLSKVLLHCKNLSQLVMPAHSEDLVNQCHVSPGDFYVRRDDLIGVHLLHNPGLGYIAGCSPLAFFFGECRHRLNNESMCIANLFSSRSLFPACPDW